MSNEIEIAELKILSKNNTEAIKALALTVDKLAQTMADEDRALHDTIIELKASRIACEKRTHEIFRRLDLKSDKIEILKVDMHEKVDKQEFNNLKSFLIKIWWTLTVALAGIIGNTIWNFTQGHGHG